MESASKIQPEVRMPTVCRIGLITTTKDLSLEDHLTQ
jgi:hypothetical protein